MRTVAMIPARAGSKRIPHKNLTLFGGRPLIAHTCEAARAAGIFDAIYVNTDSRQIADVAEQYGAHCPVLRPSALAQDDTSTELATRFFLSYLAEHGESYDALMILQPTSPLRTAADIEAAAQLYEEHAPCTVVSVAHVAPAFWLGRGTKDGQFEGLIGDEPLFKLNGAIYIFPFAEYLAGERPTKRMLYAMPTDRSIDIDTPADLEMAEYFLQRSNAVMYDPV